MVLEGNWRREGTVAFKVAGPNAVQTFGFQVGRAGSTRHDYWLRHAAASVRARLEILVGSSSAACRLPASVSRTWRGHRPPGVTRTPPQPAPVALRRSRQPARYPYPTACCRPRVRTCRGRPPVALVHAPCGLPSPGRHVQALSAAAVSPPPHTSHQALRRPSAPCWLPAPRGRCRGHGTSCRGRRAPRRPARPAAPPRCPPRARSTAASCRTARRRRPCWTAGWTPSSCCTLRPCPWPEPRAAAARPRYGAQQQPADQATHASPGARHKRAPLPGPCPAGLAAWTCGACSSCWAARRGSPWCCRPWSSPRRARC